MKGTPVEGTNLVHVEFDWSNEHGECYDCGLPAAYLIDPYGPSNMTEHRKRCSVCAAMAVALGDTVGLTYLFPELLD